MVCMRTCQPERKGDGRRDGGEVVTVQRKYEAEELPLVLVLLLLLRASKKCNK